MEGDMMENELVPTDPYYNPNALFDFLILHQQLRGDIQLSHALDASPELIEMIRNKQCAIDDSMLVKIHDLTKLPLSVVRYHMGLSANSFQPQYNQEKQMSDQANFPTNSGATMENAYCPALLLDALIDRLNLKNDAALARQLEVAPPVISKIRNRRIPVGALILVSMHEASNLSVKELRGLMGDRRNKFRGGASTHAPVKE